MVRDIKQIGDPVLDKPTIAVKNVNTPEIQGLIKDLVDTCLSKADTTAGLSAPQIGENHSVIVCRRMDLEDASDKPINKEKLWEVMINPRITKANSSESTYWEGCLSVGVGLEGLWGPVTRPDNIVIQYLNPKGEETTLKCNGFFAHIVQHEIDHLYGVLFLRYIENPELIWKNKDLEAYYDKYGEYPPV